MIYNIIIVLCFDGVFDEECLCDCFVYLVECYVVLCMCFVDDVGVLWWVVDEGMVDVMWLIVCDVEVLEVIVCEEVVVLFDFVVGLVYWFILVWIGLV